MNRLLPYDIYYENSAGDILRLDQPPFVATESKLFDSSWKMTLASRPMGEGGSLLSRRRPSADRTLTVQAAAGSAEKLSAAMNTMADVFDFDVENYTAGKLWINNSYLRCWCSGRTKSLSCDIPGQAQITVTVTPEQPAWCTERYYRLVGGDMISDGRGLAHPYRYPYRYGSSRRTLSIINTRFAPSPMLITLYGPALEPKIFIGSLCIGVNTPLLRGERVVIDQLNKRITKTGVDGKAVNCFGDRIKNGQTFEYAPPGGSVVDIFSESLGADIVLIEQRSEPSWSRV